MSLNLSGNSNIFNATSEFILLTKRLDETFKIRKVASTDYIQQNILINQIMWFLAIQNYFLVDIKTMKDI